MQGIDIKQNQCLYSFIEYILYLLYIDHGVASDVNMFSRIQCNVCCNYLDVTVLANLGGGPLDTGAREAFVMFALSRCAEVLLAPYFQGGHC